MNLAEFLNFAKSLDRVFPQPAGTIDSNFLFNNYDSSSSTPDVVDLRRRLSSLLPINYRIFSDAEKLAELSILSTNLLLRDNSLSAFQVSILKRMEQLPAMSKSIFEIKELADHLENLIFSFQFNMSKASSLWTEYNNSRQRLFSLQAEIEANDRTLQEIDEQIAKLRVRRFELQSLGEFKRKEVMDLSCSHNNIVNNLAKAIDKIKAADMTTEILNSEKKCLIDRCTEIKDKFDPLNDFTI
ncbi:Spindle assembly abnormal 6 [Melia azedarach]|uniref:Spindle assembly abnormal 6 n=1 Tax=Melia azedarach TaxID=155640 RepID=A0ACC1XPG0_MELAZ|nr:Spindle assembly abnormal 6 [Melia azedarach]